MLPMIKINLKIITVVLVSTFLNACGGGINVASVGDGITGTGITAGRVTGFGSIYVNGIKFNVNNAIFRRDGIQLQGQVQEKQGQYEIGEYVVIKGSVDGTAGVADEVIFEDLLEGVVTQASVGNIIEILGQQVEIDSKTQLIAFSNLTDLVVGNIVEVSGIRDASGVIKATSIKLKGGGFTNDSENEIKGTVSGLNTSNETFTIGNILVNYSNDVSFDGFTKQDLANNQYVEVKSNMNLDEDVLIANEIELKDEHLTVEVDSEVEIEGLVTGFGSIQGVDVFYINGIPATTNSETIYDPATANASDIILNTEIEVKGIVNSDGVLVAEKIEFED